MPVCLKGHIRQIVLKKKAILGFFGIAYTRYAILINFWAVFLIKCTEYFYPARQWLWAHWHKLWS